MSVDLSILNDQALINCRNLHFKRLQSVFEGTQSEPCQPVYLTGVVGVSRQNPYIDPERWVEEAAQSLADKAEVIKDSEVFRPLCVQYGAYGVHFIDKIFGAEVFYDQGTKMWNSKYINYPIGELEYPDLENNVTWNNAKKAALAFLKLNVKLPIFGLPTIASCLNIAVNLYGEEILVAMIMEPDKARHDLEVINRLLCDLHKWFIKTIPAEQLQPVISNMRTQPPGFGQIGGCTTQLLSAELYREFIAPLDDALLSVYPNGGMIHLCGSHTQHISVWKEMRSLRALQMNDRASEDLEEYFNNTRDDQVIYFSPTKTMTIEKALEITGGKGIVFVADIKKRKTIVNLRRSKSMEDKKYLNPLKVNNSKENNKAPDSHADPYVIKYNGEYYCYSTHGSGVPVFHSRDLTEWEYLGFALQTEGEKSFWAPAVIYNNGLFYMYYSSIKNEEDDVHREFMKVAVSKRPEGPFIYQKTLFDNFSIDAHVTRDFKGDYYLYYTVSSHSGIDGQKPGTVLLVDRLTDMMTLEGKPQVAVMPTLEEEIFEKNRFGDGRDWYCVEGPFHLTRNGREYLMFSGNAFTSHYYFVGYSVKDEKGQWHKYPNDYTYYPIIRKNEKVEGTGHNSVVRGPNNIEQWFVYHGRNIREIEDENGKMVKDKRVMRMDPLYWIGDKMWVDGPSYEERPAPFQPAFQDFFDGANGELLSDNWEVLDGSWNCLDGQLVQNDLKKNASAIADIKSCCYVMEISLKWNYSFMGGQYGVYAVYIDSKNYVQVMLDVGKKELAALEILGGVKVREFRVDLEKDFDFESYHHMRICRTGGSCQIFIDDVQKIDGRFTEKAGRVGLFTKFTSACFDGMAVTNHLELYKGSEIEFIKAVKAEIKENDECWAVRDGSLICQSGSYDRLNEIILHNPCCNEYSLSVETKLQTQSGKGMLGVHLAYKDQENRISFILDNRSLTLSLICRQEGIDKVLCEQGLPDDMKLDDTHCISAIILNKKITVRLDKYLIYSGEAACLAEGIGLCCIGDASFSALQLTGI